MEETELEFIFQQNPAPTPYHLESSRKYCEAGQKLISAGFPLMSGEELISFLYPFYNRKKRHPESPTLTLMEQGLLWVFNKNIWTPDGVYVLHDQKAEGITQDVDLPSPDKMFQGGKEIKGVWFSPEERVRFAPQETYQKETKEGFLIASLGIEQAQHFWEIASFFRQPPRIFTPNLHGEQQKQSVSALYHCYGKRGWINFYGDCLGEGKRGFAIAPK